MENQIGKKVIVRADKAGNLLPNIVNDKGHIIDYRVRLIKFKK